MVINAITASPMMKQSKNVAMQITFVVLWRAALMSVHGKELLAENYVQQMQRLAISARVIIPDVLTAGLLNTFRITICGDA